MFLVLLVLGLVFGSMFGWKSWQGQQAALLATMPPPATVAAAEVQVESWQPHLQAVGSLVANQGILVTTEVAGKVSEIRFESGQQVEVGTLLLQLDDSIDRAELEGIVAERRLAEMQFKRREELVEKKTISRSDYDEARLRLDNAAAQLATKQAQIAKKRITAPFSGWLGIRQVDPGEYLQPGTAIVPLDALIGGVDMAGQGWRMLVECLSVGRAISLPSTSTGGTKMGAFATGAYARIRKQFNMPIGRFEGIEDALARIAGNAYAISALSRMTATAVDLGEKPSVPSAIAKYHSTEMARESVRDAMDVHGGKGIILGPRNYLGRGWQGIPISITVEGANIMTRNLMIFGQGAIRCHPYVLKEMEAARIENSSERLDRFDDLLFGHVGYSMRNAVRSLVLGLSFGKFTSVPHDRKTARYYQKLSRYSASLAFVSDVAMLTLGGKLKQKEHISARLGDVLSHLYICSAMLKRFEAQGRPAADQAILAWAFHNSIYKIQQALRLVVDNFPNRYMRALLRFVVFPFGRREKAPGDRLTHKVAQLLLAPSDTRDRLTQGVYKSETSNHPICFMERALPKVIRAEPLERKMLKALRQGQIHGITWDEQIREAVEKSVLTKEEADILREVRELVAEIIADVRARGDRAVIGRDRHRVTGGPDGRPRSLVVLGTSLRGDFVWDDHAMVVENPELRDLGNIPAMFCRNYFGERANVELYRPLAPRAPLHDV